MINSSVAVAAAFVADGPADGVGLSMFCQFASSWALSGVDSAIRVRAGRLATTDVWILPGVEHGVSVRFPILRPVLVFGAPPGLAQGWRRAHTFFAAPAAGQIVLDGGDLRWTFFDVEAAAFRWHNHIQEPGGSWPLQQASRLEANQQLLVATSIN